METAQRKKAETTPPLVAVSSTTEAKPSDMNAVLFEELHEKMAHIALELDALEWRLNHLGKQCQSPEHHENFKTIKSRAHILWKDYLSRFGGDCKSSSCS